VEKKKKTYAEGMRKCARAWTASTLWIRRRKKKKKKKRKKKGFYDAHFAFLTHKTCGVIMFAHRADLCRNKRVRIEGSVMATVE
jgi:hypothetical protein